MSFLQSYVQLFISLLILGVFELVLRIKDFLVMEEFALEPLTESSLDKSYLSKWKPSEAILKSLDIKAPFIHCSPGSSRSKCLENLNSLVKKNSSDFCNCPNNVTFLMMTNLPKDVKPLAEKLYMLCNCSYIHLRLKERHHWLGPTWNSKYKVS